MLASQLLPLLPMFVVLGTAILLLLLESFAEDGDRAWAASFSVLGLAFAIYLSLRALLAGTVDSLFGGAVLVDPFSNLASILMMSAGLVACLLSPTYLRNARSAFGEYYAVLLMSIIGMQVMAMAGDLFTLFLGLEVMSIGVYILTALRKNDPRGIEAALKYFLMGAFATGFLLFGLAFVYGAAGSLNLIELRRQLASPNEMMIFGLVMILVGFAFKIAAVPFHVWAPDVYEGAPTPVTGFMAVSVKAAAFVGLLRFVVSSLSGAAASLEVVVPFLTALAYLTILGGNLLAVVQTSIKRMLAYSSIAHAGYALIGIVAAARGEESAGVAVLFYLSAYTFMTLGAFGVLTFLERKEAGREAERYGAYAGIGFKFPALGLAMTLFMIALAGMPLTGGFVGKLYLFSAALKAGMPGLVIVGVLGSVISVYYYLRVVVAFYMRDVPDPGPLPEGAPSRQIALGLGLAAFGVLVLGLFPNAWIQLGRVAMKALS